MATTHTDRLFTEVDRQLNEVRSVADGMATRAGLLISATALGASLLGSQLAQLKTGWATAALIGLGIAVLTGALVVRPGMLAGPTPSALQGWAGEPAQPTLKALYASKILALEANRERLTTMRVLFYFQFATLIGAVGLVVIAISRR